MSTNTPAIVRREEVNVCGSNILAIVTADNKCYFSPKHVCDALGIDWKSQHVKIKADPVLSQGVVEITIPSAGGAQKTTTLPIEFLSGWLFTIKKVAPELQAKLNLYRAEAYYALDAWFRQGLRSNPTVQEVLSLPDFTNPAEAARAWADEYEKRQALEIENAKLAPKAKLYDQYMDVDGTLNLTSAAKVLGFTSGRALGMYLRETLNWLFLDTKQVIPKAHVIEKGFMTTKAWSMIDRQKSGVQGLITAKGMDYLMKHFGLNEKEAA